MNFETIGRPYPKAWIIGKQLTADGKRFSTSIRKTHILRLPPRHVQGLTGPMDDERQDGSGGVDGSAA